MDNICSFFQYFSLSYTLNVFLAATKKRTKLPEFGNEVIWTQPEFKPSVSVDVFRKEHPHYTRLDLLRFNLECIHIYMVIHICAWTLPQY